jgi:hypothetical protein
MATIAAASRKAFFCLMSLSLLGLAAPLSTRDGGSVALDGGEAKVSEEVLTTIRSDSGV